MIKNLICDVENGWSTNAQVNTVHVHRFLSYSKNNYNNYVSIEWYIACTNQIAALGYVFAPIRLLH